MSCPHLRYRDADDRRTFDAERPYCVEAERFVQPMRADICNDRYGLHHESDCEIFRGEG
ncbi:MAG: hypothetical protein ACLFMX_02205 [Halobacteriales archaeon]